MTDVRQTRLNLDNFRDSDYAAELRRGVSHRPFAPTIEAEYRESHLDRVHRRVRAWYLLSAVMAVIFSAVQVRTTELRAMGSLLQLLVLTPCAFTMAVVVWTGYYRRLFMPLTQVVPAFMVASSAAICAIDILNGATQEISVLAINVFATFFFCGLMFMTAVVAVVAMLASYAAVAVFGSMPLELAAAGVLLILITAGISTIVCQEIETGYRRNFLEGVLIRELAARDGLTGVMNRRAFDEHLLRLWQQGMRDKRNLTLMIIDLDHFKALNDLHGHQAGDAALRRVAQTLQNFARRPLDIAARYGGEEFAILLYDFAEAQTSVMTEQLRRAIEGLGIAHGAAIAGPVVTVSIGVGVVEPAIDRTPQGAIQLADEALYEAKRLGRNRVAIRGVEQYKKLETGSFTAQKASA